MARRHLPEHVSTLKKHGIVPIDLVAVNLYLQAVTAGNRIDLARAQLDTAQALGRQATDLKASGLVANVDDISPRRRAEEGLRRAQWDLAHVARVTTLGELAASIAHEIYQPLAAIGVNAKASLTSLENPTPDLTLVLDIPVSVGRERQKASGKAQDRIEREDDTFHTRVREAYRSASGPAIVHIDASQSKKAVQDAAWQQVPAVTARTPSLRGA